MRWHVDGYGLLSTQISLSCFVRTQIETHSTHLTGELQHLAFFGGRVISHITYLHAGLTVEMRPLPKLSAISPYKVKKNQLLIAGRLLMRGLSANHVLVCSLNPSNFCYILANRKGYI